MLFATNYVDFFFPLEIEDSDQWKEVRIKDSGRFETSWTSRLNGHVFRWTDLNDDYKFGFKNEDRSNWMITRNEYKYCFYQCEQTAGCKAFQIVVKKRFISQNVICRLNLADSNKVKKVNKEKYLASAVGFMDYVRKRK